VVLLISGIAAGRLAVSPWENVCAHPLVVCHK
jgi:hypothetical protein